MCLAVASHALFATCSQCGVPIQGSKVSKVPGQRDLDSSCGSTMSEGTDIIIHREFQRLGVPMEEENKRKNVPEKLDARFPLSRSATSTTLHFPE